jgi:AcrR family transcriptional regulator
MSRASVAPSAAPVADSEPPDGRRLRSERSRTQIIKALFALIREGDMSPSAARVAERAAVGARTVFRHFEDMDSLFVEMSEQLMAEITPIIQAPFTASGWEARLRELVQRRADVYERIFPLRVAANLRRFQSKFLMDAYQRALVIERESLTSILPAHIASNPPLIAALEVATGFQTWRRLRQDQGLSRQDAETVVGFMVTRLVPA